MIDTLWYGQSEGKTIQVVEDDTHRYMLFEGDGGECQSSISLNSWRSGNPYTDGFHLAKIADSDTERVLFIGGGGCIGPVQFQNMYPEIQIDVVENDRTVAMLATRYFGANDINIIVADGRKYLETCSDDYYDIIIIDAYGPNSCVPAGLATVEFFQEVRRVSRVPVMVNYIGTMYGSVMYKLHNTMSLGLDTTVIVFPVPSGQLRQNVLMLSSFHSPETFLNCAKRRDSTMIPHLVEIAKGGQYFKSGDKVYWDQDFFDKEWLYVP